MNNKYERKEEKYGEADSEYEIDDATATYQNLTRSLLQKRDEAVTYRANCGVERRWREAVRAYEGFDEMTVTTKGHSVVDYASGDVYTTPNESGHRSKVVANVIRGKCDIAIGRFCDIIMPVDGEPSYDMEPTPVPDLVKGINDDRQVMNMATGEQMTKSDGSPMRAKDIARVHMDKANESMNGMKDVINDQLIECHYDSHARKAVRAGIILGTGVICGPEVVSSYTKKWSKYNDGTDSVRVMEAIQKNVPQARNVDIWGLFPSPDADENPHETASYFFEVSKILPRNLKKLALSDSYFGDAIMRVLDSTPLRTHCELNDKGSDYVITASEQSRGAAYELWKYTGEIDKDDLEAMGCDCSDFQFMSISATAEFVNDVLIRVSLNPLDTGGLNYYFWQWTEVDGSPWGIGIPTIAMWQQKVVTAAWRAMMDNAGDSAGAMTVISSVLKPYDGDYTLTRNKMWLADTKIDDVRKAFASFQINNNQQPLGAIIELALKFLDLETTIPNIFQGERSGAPETFGATAIMIDSNNVALRTRVKTWDDKVTKPMIEGFYDWNMQYHDDDNIKGDWKVKPIGASHHFERDQQTQLMGNIFNLKNDPDFAKKIDWDKVIQLFFSSRGIDVLKSDDTIDREEEQRKKHEAEKQQNGQPDDQRAQASLQVAQIRSKSEIEKAQLVQESDMAELKFKAEEAERQRQHEREMKQIELQIKQMEFNYRQEGELNKIKADLSKEASKQNLQRELSDNRNNGPQVATPPTEPAGRAPGGQAYQR